MTYGYDKNNNATSVQETIAGVAYTTRFSYNSDDSLKSVTIDTGTELEYFYDEKGLPRRVVTTLNPNLVQNPTFARGLDSWENTRYMQVALGGLYGNSAARGLGYHLLRQYFPGLEEGTYTLTAYVKVVSNPAGAGEFTARIYDAENNILAISEKIFHTGGEWVRVTAAMETPGVPAYIALLAGSTSSLYTGEEEALWDGVQFEKGESTQFTTEKKRLYTDYEYNPRGLLGALRHSLDSYAYEYDLNGNITRITRGNGDEARYTYDSLNQLVRETLERGGITTRVEYQYDGQGGQRHPRSNPKRAGRNNLDPPLLLCRGQHSR